MTFFRFAITADTTMTANVVVEADNIEEAHEIATTSQFYEDPKKAAFVHDDGNNIQNVYLPDENNYETFTTNPKASPTKKPKKGKTLIGFQICNRTGQKMLSDENNPTGNASFEIYDPKLAAQLAEKVGSQFLLQPIFHGDIEKPTIITSL